MAVKNNKTLATHDSHGNLTGSLSTAGKKIPTVSTIKQKIVVITDSQITRNPPREMSPEEAIKARIDMLGVEEIIRFWQQMPPGAFAQVSEFPEVEQYLRARIKAMKKQFPDEWRIAQAEVGLDGTEWMNNEARYLAYLCDCKPKDCWHK
jgi:hypothetical protein